jgi:hypothetical protein
MTGMPRWGRVAAIALMCAAGACADARSPAGLALPTGDPEAGRQVFLDLRCCSCHRVAGLDLPSPVASPEVPVVLGGRVASPVADGALITAIVNPSHGVSARHQPDLVKVGQRSRMGDFSGTMTVRQLVDLVAFLRAQYEVVPGMAPPPRR